MITLFSVGILTLIYRMVIGASRRVKFPENIAVSYPAADKKTKISTYYTAYTEEVESKMKYAEELLSKGDAKQAVEISYSAVQSVFGQLLGKVLQGDTNFSLPDAMKLLSESGFVTSFQNAVEGLNDAKLRSVLGRGLSIEQATAAVSLAKLIIASAKEVPFRPRTQA